MSDDEVEIEKPTNAVMKILIGILIFVFVGLPVGGMLTIMVLVTLGGNASSEENSLPTEPAPYTAPIEAPAD